jgi:hypothetical protein
MTHVLPLIRPARVRLDLVLLHSLFLILYGLHLQWLLSRPQAGLSVVLATLALLILTIPRASVETAWFIGLVTLGNTGILLLTFWSQHRSGCLGP